jgi:hypothetical protein
MSGTIARPDAVTMNGLLDQRFDLSRSTFLWSTLPWAWPEP